MAPPAMTAVVAAFPHELPRCAGFRLRRKGRLRRPMFISNRGLLVPGTRLLRSPAQPTAAPS
jgi:hypothetical protein